VAQSVVLFVLFLVALGALRRWASGPRTRRAVDPPPPESGEGPRAETPDPTGVAARLLAEGPTLVEGLREAGLHYEASRVEVVLRRVRRWLPPHDHPSAAAGADLVALVEELRSAGLVDEAAPLEVSAESAQRWLPDEGKD